MQVVGRAGLSLAWLALICAGEVSAVSDASCAEEESVMMQLKTKEQKGHESQGVSSDEHRPGQDCGKRKKEFFDTPEIMAEWVAVEVDPVPGGGAFKPDMNTITGIKLCNPHVAKACKDESIFVTIPRWAMGVAYTLTVVEEKRGGGHVLKPWPSAEAQAIGDCSKIQYVQSMEIDPDGVMWVIDAGHLYMSPAGPAPVPFNRSVNAQGVGVGPDGPDLTCPPKMVLIDIPTGKVIQTYVFPASVVAYTAPNPFFGTFLNDIVIDSVKQVAYISDLSGPDGEGGGIVVYDRKCKGGKGCSRRFYDATTGSNPGALIYIDFHNYTDLISGAPTDGIALSADRKWVYYSHLGNPGLWKASADALSDLGERKGKWKSAVQQSIVKIGELNGLTDGMTFGENGMLFTGAYNLNGMDAYDISGDKLKTVKSIRDRERAAWVDTWAWDNKGYLWMTSNRLNQWFFGSLIAPTMDFSGSQGTNFKLMKTWVGTNSYICAQEGVDCSGSSKHYGSYEYHSYK